MVSIAPLIVQFTELKNVSDVLVFSLYGVLFVLFGLFILSLVLMLFKFINKREIKNLEIEEDKKEIYQGINELKVLNDDIVTAIITAIAIEEKLYYDENLSDLTFNYQGKSLSGWQLSGLVDNRS